MKSIYGLNLDLEIIQWLRASGNASKTANDILLEEMKRQDVKSMSKEQIEKELAIIALKKKQALELKELQNAQ